LSLHSKYNVSLAQETSKYYFGEKALLKNLPAYTYVHRDKCMKTRNFSVKRVMPSGTTALCTGSIMCSLWRDLDYNAV